MRWRLALVAAARGGHMHNQHDERDGGRAVYALSRKFQCRTSTSTPCPPACAWTTAWQRRCSISTCRKWRARGVGARAGGRRRQKCRAKLPAPSRRLGARPATGRAVLLRYETTWDNAVAAYARADRRRSSSTMIREPIAWAFSKITHKKNRRVQSTVAAGYRAPSPFDWNAQKSILLDSRSNTWARHWDRRATRRPKHSWRRGASMLSIVGLVEELDASLCLWEYQFGHHRANATDYARRCDCRGAARRRGFELRGIAGVESMLGKYGEQVSLRAVLRIEAALGHARLYDAAGLFGVAGLFRRRDRLRRLFYNVEWLSGTGESARQQGVFFFFFATRGLVAAHHTRSPRTDMSRNGLLSTPCL